MKMRGLITLLAALPMCIAAASAPAATFPGRVALSNNGNKHDCDDIAASAVTIALLAKTGNAGKLAYCDYADHIWASAAASTCQGGSASRETKMRDSTLGTAQRYGGFNTTVFFNARANTPLAVARLTAAINASTSSNPLWILAAGPMEVVGRALYTAASSRRQYVTVVSHSTWNDNHADRPYSNEQPQHSGWTLDEIRRMSSPPKVVHLPDQNAYLNTPFSTYYVWRDSSDSRKRWLWQRIQMQNIGKTTADISDAGMTYWLVRGRQIGDTRASASEVKALIQ
jgi:hypothetical protein